MCGILGSLNFATDKVSFTNALKKLTARGPDESGIYCDQYVFLGNTRLSIIDLDHGQQPIQNENGAIITVFNGEIYNYLKLKTWLKKKGHVFKTDTDTEVLVHLYEECGVKMAEYLDGMFAFAIWDREKKKLLLCRDHFGKKPLVYYFKNNVLAFASEAKALLTFPFIRQHLRVDPKSLVKCLFYGYIPSPHSIYENLYRLRPAEVIEFAFEDGVIRKKEINYWKLQSKSSSYYFREEDILDELDSLILKSVKKRMMADVPIGAFLSGGIDSAMVVAYLTRIERDVDTYTITYDMPDIDESSYAREIAGYLGIKNQQYVLSESEVVNSLPVILNYLDEPMVESSIIPSYFVSKFARESVKVALSGDGGDEVFGGYRKYIAHRLIEQLGPLVFLARFIPHAVTRIIDAFVKDDSNRQVFKMLLSTMHYPLGVRNIMWTGGCFYPEEIHSLMKEPFFFTLEEITEDLLYYSNGYSGDSNSPQNALFLDTRIQLPDWYLLKTDWASMSNSLEVRSPLLDKELSEFLFSLPFSVKVKGFQTKYIFKKLAKKYLPPKIIHRKKQGFGLQTIAKWINTGLKDMILADLSNSFSRFYFRQEYIVSLLDNHFKGKADNSVRLWRLFLICHILESNQNK